MPILTLVLLSYVLAPKQRSRVRIRFRDAFLDSRRCCVRLCATILRGQAPCPALHHHLHLQRHLRLPLARASAWTLQASHIGLPVAHAWRETSAKSLLAAQARARGASPCAIASDVRPRSLKGGGGQEQREYQMPMPMRVQGICVGGRSSGRRLGRG